MSEELIRYKRRGNIIMCIVSCDKYSCKERAEMLRLIT